VDRYILLYVTSYTYASATTTERRTYAVMHEGFTVVLPQTSEGIMLKPMNEAGLLYNFYHLFYLKTYVPSACVSSIAKIFEQKFWRRMEHTLNL
jgi:hypothetical protein